MGGGIFLNHGDTKTHRERDRVLIKRLPNPLKILFILLLSQLDLLYVWQMTSKQQLLFPLLPEVFVVADLSDCYTWSFPEFVPFCQRLYYFSSFKLFPSPALR